MSRIRLQCQECEPVGSVRCLRCGSREIAPHTGSLLHVRKTTDVWSSGARRVSVAVEPVPYIRVADPAWEPPSRCSACGTDEGSRFRCARLSGTVLCRDCCIVELDGHRCNWWDLCNETDLSIWEW